MHRLTGRADGLRTKGRAWPAIAAIGALLATTAVAAPANAGTVMSKAEKIRRLDIMLMVTGLRCRNTADNFQADYGRFTSRQLPALNRASAQLRAELAARPGAAGGARALDRLSVEMANSYGLGHPWLGCHELKMITQNLAEVNGDDTLAEAADQLLAPAGRPQVAYVLP